MAVRPEAPAATPNRILICRPNSRLGNTLLLTPLVQELEHLFPGAEIDLVLACPAAADVFREYASVRTIHQLPRLTARHPIDTLATFFLSKRIRYDLVIDPCPRSWSSRFWTRSMHARANKLGFLSPQKANGVGRAIPIDAAPKHMGQYPVYLVRQLVDASTGTETQRALPHLDLKLTAAECEFGARKLRQLLSSRVSDGPVISLFLNATGNKRMRPTFWRQLLQQLREYLPESHAIEIVPAHGERNLPELQGYYSTDIRRMAAVISATECFISADSGVMHLGAATGTTTIGLFKVTDIAKYAPYGGNNAAVQVDESAPERAIREIAQHILFGAAKRSQDFA